MAASKPKYESVSKVSYSQDADTKYALHFLPLGMNDG